MTRSEPHLWQKRFAAFLAINTLMLIGLGGLVTSKGAGMAVPDWPTTYGYNMFFFPFHLWTGGIFYEHTHRLFASWVGFLTVILAVWMGWKESRPWVRRLGFLALALVILQGVLGGLRVVWLKDYIGIVHASLAQGFLALVVALTLFSSSLWQRLGPSNLPVQVRNLLGLAAVAIFAQLLLGAAMRHQHSGLAVPDFPLAYGRLYPPTDATFLQHVNQAHAEVTITPLQIHLHMAHRFGALVLLCLSGWVTYRVARATVGLPLLRRGVLGWQALIYVQALLGACTVWTGKAADVATLHVVVGAVSLFTAVALCLMAHRCTGVPAARWAGDSTLGAEPDAQPRPARRPTVLAATLESR